MKKARIAGLVNDSVVDGPGLRFTVFFQGCVHHCYQCHNPETHRLNGGYEKNAEDIVSLFEKNPLLDGITLSGGEPFLQYEAAAYIAEAAKKLGLNVIVYTGYTFEELHDNPIYKNFLQFIDILIDGKFIYEQRSLDLRFRGSANQRSVDVQKSLQNQSVNLYKL